MITHTDSVDIPWSFVCCFHGNAHTKVQGYRVDSLTFADFAFNTSLYISLNAL